MTLAKKFVTAALATATVLSMSGALAMTANAQTADIQAQIQALLAQIAQLQAQMGSSSGSTMSASCTFTRSLTVGMRGDDVTCLQNALISGGYLAAGLNTGYFGGLTKAAVVKWQKAAGVSPASGYFGPLSRSAFASSMSTGGSTGGNTGGSTGGVVPTSGVAVALSSDSATGSAIAGAGQISVGNWLLTASNAGSVNVTGMTFNKVGVVSDSQISNMYLTDPNTGAVIAQYSSLSNGVATFSGLNLTVGAGQTMKVGLRIDLSSGASAGNTLAFSLATVQTSGNSSVSGLPSQGNTLTVTTVSNPSLATVSWDFNAVGSSVDAGTNNVQIATAAVTVSNSAVWLKSVKYTVVGSANMADVKNLKLMVNGTQVGTTVAMPNSDGTVVFGLASNPVKVGTGNNTVDLYADIAGSPNRDITVRVLRPYDLYFTDSQYNSGISPTVTDDSNKITINQGQITVQLSSDTPTGNIAIGASNVTLAKYTIFASGEPVKVLALDLKLDKTAGGNWTGAAAVNADITNIQLLDDAGNQIGSTISTVVGGSGNGQCDLNSSTSITCHFGTTSSPINYIVPANTTRVISAKVDVKSNGTATSLKASLPGTPTSNLQGQISFQTASSGAASGAVLTVVTSPLTIAANGSFAAPTYVAGATNAKIASFVLTASSADGAKVNTFTISKGSISGSATSTFDIQNAKVMVGSTQCGATRPTVGDTEASLAFSCNPAIVVPAGGSVTVDVYADILTTTTAVTQTHPIGFYSWSATGQTTNSAITSPSAFAGQDVVISSGPTLTVAQDGSTPSARQIVMGTQANPVLAVLLSANNVEDVKVTSLQFLDTITNGSAGKTSFANMTLWNGSTQLGGAQVPTIADTSTSTVTFSLSSPLIVPKNGSVTLTLKGDVSDFSSGAVSNSSHTWSVYSTSTLVSYGASSNQSATVSGSASGNAQTVYRTKLTFTSSVIGSTVGRVRTAVDDLANINWTANSAYQVVLNSVTIKFTGQAVSNGSSAFTVDLLKSDNTALGSASQQTCTPAAGNTCSVTFTPDFTISAGQTQVSKVRVNSANFYDAASQSESLSVLINATGDLTWNDGTTVSIPVESSVVPFTVASVQY